MGFFKRNKDEEVKIQLEREALDKLNGNNIDDFAIPSDTSSDNFDSSWQISGKTRAPHTITAEELNSKVHKNEDSSNGNTATLEIPMSGSEEGTDSPTDFLYQKMMRSRAKVLETSIEPTENTDNTNNTDNSDNTITESPATTHPTESDRPFDLDAAINEIINSVNQDSNGTEAPKEKDEPKIEPSSSNAVPILENTENSDSAKEKSDANNSDDIISMGASAEERRATLLARCNAYLEDESEPAKTDTEKYILESVESILEGFEARAAERANKKFTNSPSNSAPKVYTPGAPTTPHVPKVENPDFTDATVTFTAQNPHTQKTNTDADNIPPASSDSNFVRHIFTATDGNTEPSATTDDFSSTRVITDISSHSNPVDIPSGKTSVFPIVEPISSTSKADNEEEPDINNAYNEENHKNNFEDYESVADRPKILKGLLHKKKVSTIKLIFSVLALASSVLILTPIGNRILPFENSANIIDLLICLLVTFVNFDALICITSLFNPKTKSGLPAALSLISATVFSVINLVFKSDFIGFSAVVSLGLVSYCLANRNFYSKTIKNFNIIATPEFKNSVSIIKNKNATKTIVGDSIDGSALVCYGGETTNIHNFLRYSYCKNPISEKIQKFSLISVILAIGLSLASLLLSSGDWIVSIYIFTAVICFSAIPSVYHIVSLTINCANKRLNHYDAMITGYHAAEELELCNAIAVNCSNLFPEGTVRLVDMKLLSPNPFDQSMLDAAAITIAIHSPLAGIFKQMDTSKAYNINSQEVDSVIYEEKMGVSGWVNDRRVFVGNRDLLIAHGFAGLPPAELDKKIMRKGYFPVYIASNNILCALLVVKYEPDENIIYEMQRLANTGTTIIVNNCDPNINAKMLADYFELYDETVCIMSKQGADFHKALTTHKEHRHAGAAYKSKIEGLFAALTASINIKKYISRMTAFYICSIVLGLLAITTCIFTNLTSYITPLNLLLSQILLTAITLLPTILRKP